ncbi:MAG: glycosyltransferase [Rhodocyclaceae bacterium]
MTTTPAPLIALFLGNLEMGGAERVFITLAHQFMQRGCRVRLILAHKTGALLTELDPAIEIIDLQAVRSGQPRWLFALRTLFALRRHLRDDPPQALLSTLTGANLIAILARALSGQSFRLVIREAVTLPNVRSWLRLTAMRWLYPRADKVVVLTGPMREQLKDTLNLAASAMVVIGNPLNSERIAQLVVDPTEHQRSKAHVPYWLAIGRLVLQKDFATLIEAAAELNRDGGAPRIVILGDGPLRHDLETQINRLNLKPRIVLAGFTTNPYPWLANASGYVLSSRWEGYPNVLLEALHFNLPIVATRYDDSVAELLESPPNVQHRLVPIGDPVSMANAIRSLASTPRSGKHQPPPGQDTAAAAVQTIVDRYLALLLPQ